MDKKRKLRSIVTSEIRAVLGTSKEFVAGIKVGLAGSNLRSVSKKELESVCRELILQECIKEVEKHRSMVILKNFLEEYIKDLLGKTCSSKLAIRKTNSSLYVETLDGEVIFRVFTVGLDLKLACGTDTIPLKVIEDLHYFRSIIKDQVALRNKK